jgi:sn-glycerol 3-phosphate transport system substrate-binding protein
MHRSRLTARHRTPLGILAAVALVAAACSEPPTSGSGEGAQVQAGDGGDIELPECPLDALEEASAEGPVEITLWYGGLGGPSQDVMEDMATQFNASQDEVVVTPQDQGASYQEVFRKFESTASASTGQLPQIVYTEDTTLRAMVDAGHAFPAEACMEASGYDLTDIEPAVRSAFSADGVFYPGYANVSMPVLYYNKAHWVRAGLDPEAPPETLDELYDQAVALREAGVSEKPFAIRLSHSYFKNWLTGLGVDVVNHENGREGSPTAATFDTPELTDVLELLQRMNDEGLLNVFSATEGGIDQFLALVNQQSSMLTETSTASATIAAALAGTISAQDAGVGFDPDAIDLSNLVPGAGQFPGVEAPGRADPGGGVFYIVNEAEPVEQAAAWRYMEFMLRPENAQRWHIEAGFLPIVKAVQDDPQVQAFWEEDLGGLMLSSAVEQFDEVDPDEPGPLIGPYLDYVDELEQAVEAVLLDGADIGSSLATAEQNVTESLERYEGE